MAEINEVRLTDVQNHVMKIRNIIADWETWVLPADDGAAVQMMWIPPDEARELIKCAKCWCDITEAVWLGKGEEQH